jgi:N-acyl-L-homoserine lactone synthetase
MSAASSSSPSDGRAALDRLSARLLAAASPLRVTLATSAAEREAAYGLRHLHVTGRDGGRERDAYDDGALHVCAFDDGALVGTVRLVLPAPGRPLPVEADFDLEVEPRGAVAEAGRLVIAPAYRGDPAHRAWGALFARAWLTLREHDLGVLAGAATADMVERLRALGLPFEILGPAREHWGEQRHPVRLDPAQGDPRWY